MILTYTQKENKEDWYFPTTDTYVVMRLECHESLVQGEFKHLYVEESVPFNSLSEFMYKFFRLESMMG